MNAWAAILVALSLVSWDCVSLVTRAAFVTFLLFPHLEQWVCVEAQLSSSRCTLFLELKGQITVQRWPCPQR